MNLSVANALGVVGFRRFILPWFMGWGSDFGPITCNQIKPLALSKTLSLQKLYLPYALRV